MLVATVGAFIGRDVTPRVREAEHGPGLAVSRDLPKLGYKGVESARQLTRYAAVRIHGGYGYSTECDVEPYFSDAPLMVGEGTNEIQRSVIVAQLVARGGI